MIQEPMLALTLWQLPQSEGAGGLALKFFACHWCHLASVWGWGHCSPAQLLLLPSVSTSCLYPDTELLAGS